MCCGWPVGTERLQVVVTGASGFVGSALCGALRRQELDLLEVSRRPGALAVEELLSRGDRHLRRGAVVIHTAGRAHVLRERSADPEAAYREVNERLSLDLCECAARCGAGRFIFVSSVKVNGEATSAEQPFRANDVPAPQDDYGRSKLAAEVGIRGVCDRTGMPFVVIRPPLIYGPGVKANFLRLIRALERGIPLPLGAVHNRRSLVALDNLVDLLVTCIDHSAAVNETFLVSDGEDLSTTDLLRRMGRALGKPARLIPVPVRWLTIAAAPLGKSGVVQRLCESLQVDISKTRQLLGWSPPIGVDEGLRRTVEAYWREARI